MTDRTALELAAALTCFLVARGLTLFETARVLLVLAILLVVGILPVGALLANLLGG